MIWDKCVTRQIPLCVFDRHTHLAVYLIIILSTQQNSQVRNLKRYCLKQVVSFSSNFNAIKFITRGSICIALLVLDQRFYFYFFLTAVQIGLGQILKILQTVQDQNVQKFKIALSRCYFIHFFQTFSRKFKQL